MKWLPLGVKPHEFVASLSFWPSARYHSSALTVKLAVGMLSPMEGLRSLLRELRRLLTPSREGRSGRVVDAEIRDVISSGSWILCLKLFRERTSDFDKGSSDPTPPPCGRVCVQWPRMTCHCVWNNLTICLTDAQLKAFASNNFKIEEGHAIFYRFTFLWNSFSF